MTSFYQKGSDHMDFLKGIFYLACGCLMTICYYTGHQILMNWLFAICLPFVAWDLAKAITPYQKAQKKD